MNCTYKYMYLYCIFKYTSILPRPGLKKKTKTEHGKCYLCVFDIQYVRVLVVIYISHGCTRMCNIWQSMVMWTHAIAVNPSSLLTPNTCVCLKPFLHSIFEFASYTLQLCWCFPLTAQTHFELYYNVHINHAHILLVSVLFYTILARSLVCLINKYAHGML